MTHNEEFLKTLISSKVTGNFPPFTKGNIDEVENYIKQIVDSLKKIESLNVEADFDYYGSGFASYINLKISKKDGSDTRITNDGEKRTEWTNGLLIYISNLSPNWYYGGSKWTKDYINDKWRSGSSGFLQPESIEDINQQLWRNEVSQIEEVFKSFKYTLLAEDELSKELWFDIDIPTILADKPYQVFDCFFYWED